MNNKIDYKFPDIKRVSILEGGEKIYSIMCQVEEGGERVLITRNGIEIGAICPIEDLIAMEGDLIKPSKRKSRKKTTRKNKSKPAK